VIRNGKDVRSMSISLFMFLEHTAV